MLMSDVWNDPFCRPADVLIKSLSVNGDIWLTWLGSVLAAPMSAGTGDGYIRADSESSRHDWKLFRVSHMPLHVEHTLLFTLWQVFFWNLSDMVMKNKLFHYKSLSQLRNMWTLF